MRFVRFAAIFFVFLSAAASAKAQQTTGQVGSPDAATTVDNRYLPAPPQKFEGQIGINADQSRKRQARRHFRWPYQRALLGDPISAIC
jgi:hypothetical protein